MVTPQSSCSTSSSCSIKTHTVTTATPGAAISTRTEIIRIGQGQDELTTSLLEILDKTMPKASRYKQGWCSNRWLDDFLKMMKARVRMSPTCIPGLSTLVSCTEGTLLSMDRNILSVQSTRCFSRLCATCVC